MGRVLGLSMNEHTVLINLFEVAPENQEELCRLLADGASRIASAQPGFVAARLHKSYDGRSVANLVEWETAEDWEAAHQRNAGTNPDFDRHMADVKAIAKAAPNTYEVVFECSAKEAR
jgi:Antibiotic biosynthesis monooxygenase